MRMKTVAAGFAVLVLGAALSACDGDDGMDGVPGPQGPEGPEGPQGPDGAPGAGNQLIELNLLGRYASGVFDEGAAEIVAYDPATQRLFVVNAAEVSVDVLDISNPAAPAKVTTIDAAAEGGSANSVAVHGDLVAVAIEAPTKTDNGKVVFYDAQSLDKLAEAGAGALPDMVAFTPDGSALLVANEGEPDDDYTIDPPGSVSVIDLRDGVNNLVVRTAGFEDFDSQADALRDAGVRIFGPGASVAQDVEPEYIAFAPDGLSAWVVLQENNAAAVLDLSDPDAPEITRILPFGLKDYNVLGNELDASNRDDRINIRNWPVKGMYMPDALAAYSVNGKTYYVTANEGDARDYDGFSEEARVKDFATLADGVVAASGFPDSDTLKQDALLGRLTVSDATSPRNDSDEVTEIHAFGARSFSIWDEDGVQLYDSGADFERITAQRYPQFFNATNTGNGFDGRSDDKGPEPEGVAIGWIGGRHYAFIGLERISGVMVYDISNPQNAHFIQYINTRDFTKEPDDPSVGDIGAEGMVFISADDSPGGEPLLVIGNEVSGTTAIYGIDVIELGD